MEFNQSLKAGLNTFTQLIKRLINNEIKIYYRRHLSKPLKVWGIYRPW